MQVLRQICTLAAVLAVIASISILFGLVDVSLRVLVTIMVISGISVVILLITSIFFLKDEGTY